MKKKVAFLVAGINAGGTENYLLRFLEYYKNKIDATVYCKSGKLGELESEFREIGVKLVPFHLGYFNLLEYYKFKKKIEKEKYDAVCDLTGSFGALPLLFAKKAGIPKRVAFYRNSKEKYKNTYLKSKYSDFLIYLLPKVSTKILSNSRTALNYFYGNLWINKTKFDVVYNGIDALSFIDEKKNLRNEFSIAENSFVVGHVGRLNDQKNHQTILKVAIELCKTYKDIYFVLCGKNVDKEYQSLVDDNKLSDKIKLLGVRRDVNKVLNTLDCFYFPSVIEGQPNALIEALVMGIPFVASEIEPIKETIPKEYHNLLIPPLDVKLAKSKILEIKNNSEIKNKINLSEWAIEFYNPAKLFHLVYREL